MLAGVDVAGLIDRLQAHALADAGGTMTDSQVDAAVALLDRVLPHLHHVELTVSGRALCVVEGPDNASKVGGD